MKKTIVESIVNTLATINYSNQLVFEIQLESDKIVTVSELATIDEKLCKIKQINLYIRIDDRYSKKMFRCHMTSQSFNANQVYQTATHYTDALTMRKQKSNYYIADYNADKIVDIVHALQHSVYDYLLDKKRISQTEYDEKFNFSESLEISLESSTIASEKETAKQA